MKLKENVVVGKSALELGSRSSSSGRRAESTVFSSIANGNARGSAWGGSLAIADF
jgi:hypothetical protein